MKIAILTDGIHPYVIGGMQKHSFYLVRELARNGHTVYLFHCNESKYDATKLDFFSEEERKHIKSFVIPFPHKSYYPFHYLFESYSYSESIYTALKPFLAEIDFIFAQGFCAWALLNISMLKPIPPVAIHFHGLEMYQNIPSFKAQISRYFLRRLVKHNIDKANYAISYGGKITTILGKITDKRKIWEVPAAIESSWPVEKPIPVSDKVRFVFVGRYERRKGIPELNQAIEKLSGNTGFTIDFIGDIPEQKKLSYPFVKYHGKLSSEGEIKQILCGCDVLVCPSYAEGMPNVIMEAMACGLAIIATNVGAVSLLVDKQNGYLLPGPKVNLIHDAMKDLISRKTELPAMKQASLTRIKENFLMEAVTKQLLTKLENIL